MYTFLAMSLLGTELFALAFHPLLSPNAPAWQPMLLAAFFWSLALNIVLAVPKLRRWLYRATEGEKNI